MHHLEFQRTHTLCALSMQQYSTAIAGILHYMQCMYSLTRLSVAYMCKPVSDCGCNNTPTNLWVHDAIIIITGSGAALIERHRSSTQSNAHDIDTIFDEM